MTTVLCTLYNSLYLDKGLVLYDSLLASAKDFKLYVLCMDDKCYKVLSDLKQEHHIPVRLADFEAGDAALLKAKGNRSMGEYCWTCSSSFIRYVLKHYNESVCTYIDADMYFYRDPQVLVDEMMAAGKSVMVVPHGFPEEKKELAKTVGTFCVEFNTFLNSPDSLEVLEDWRNKCLDCCSNLGDGVHWGDQKYLDEMVSNYACVHVCENNGAGVAPWNIEKYSLRGGQIVYDESGSVTPIVFIHFQGISYVSKFYVSTGVEKRPAKNIDFVKKYYKPYLKGIAEKQEILNSLFNVNILITKHPSSKVRFSFIKNKEIRMLLTFIKRSLISSIIHIRLT